MFLSRVIFLKFRAVSDGLRYRQKESKMQVGVVVTVVIVVVVIVNAASSSSGLVSIDRESRNIYA